MRPNVLLQVTELRELPLANFTPVGLDSQMNPGVLREIGTIGEGFATLRTLVRFGFAHMRLRVELELRFGTEYLKQINKMFINARLCVRS